MGVSEQKRLRTNPKIFSIALHWLEALAELDVQELKLSEGITPGAAAETCPSLPGLHQDVSPFAAPEDEALQ